MPSVKKVQAVEELTEKLSAMSVAVATDFSGISVNAMAGLRRHMRSQNVEYRVVKNTITGRAADVAGRPEIKEILEGPTGLVFGYGDPIQPIKALLDYVRSNRLPMVVRAATLNGQVFRGASLTALTTLPSREELVAQLLRQMSLPATRLVTALNYPLTGLVTVLSSQVRSLVTVLQQRIVQQGGA